MKKFIAVLLSLLLLGCALYVPVSAVDDNGKTTYLFMDKYYASFGGMINEVYENDNMTDFDKEQYYKELFYHYDKNGDVDWVFVYGKTNWSIPDICYYHIGNRLISTGTEEIPFSLCYGVYDVEDGKFYDVAQIWNDEKYTGVTELFEQACDNGFVDYNTGLVIGDLNNDGFVSISDATYLQKCLAGLEEYPVTPELQQFIDQKVGLDPKGFKTFDVNDFFDVNKDGTVSIGDATKLQRITAEMDIY